MDAFVRDAQCPALPQILQAMVDHKSLEAWKEAHRVLNAALDLARRCWRPDLGPVYTQLTRAALSAQINISEGYGLGTRRHFLHHLRIARGSAIETGDLLELLLERHEIPEAVGIPAVRSCQRCQRLLIGLIKKYQAG